MARDNTFNISYEQLLALANLFDDWDEYTTVPCPRGCCADDVVKCKFCGNYVFTRDKWGWQAREELSETIDHEKDCAFILLGSLSKGINSIFREPVETGDSVTFLLQEDE